MEFINELVEKLKERDIPMKKATENQIKDLLSITKNGILPKAYIEFMSIMGNGTEGKYMRGESCFMDEIHILKQGAIELLEENESELVLTDNDFVFWMSQGCIFCMFKLNEGDNPPVYFYNESGDDRFLKISNTLTEFLINYLELKSDLFQEK
ncbi:SMI1/KNR4 family protein [Lachnospiraceae bacterium 46-61]